MAKMTHRLSPRLKKKMDLKKKRFQVIQAEVVEEEKPKKKRPAKKTAAEKAKRVYKKKE